VLELPCIYFSRFTTTSDGDVRNPTASVNRTYAGGASSLWPYHTTQSNNWDDHFEPCYVISTTNLYWHS